VRHQRHPQVVALGALCDIRYRDIHAHLGRVRSNGGAPAEVLVPGVALHIEVDPDGVVPSASGSVLRVPDTGAAALDVRPVRPFRLRLVPIHHSMDSELTLSRGQAVTRMVSDIFPFAEFDVDVREPYVTRATLSTDQGWYDLIYEIALLRADDGSDRYYYGGFQRPLTTSILGLGYIGYPVSIGSEDAPGTIAHEIGHNLSLPHAPCGGPSEPDGRFPYEDGSIGQFGYDRRQGRVFDPTRHFDLMSYCDPIWISDYNYQRVMAYRDTSLFDAEFEDPSTGEVRAPTERVLVIGGGVRDGELVLQPAVEWNAPATVSGDADLYTVEGLDTDGRPLFSVPVQPLRLDHGENTMFLVSVPIEEARPDRLATLRLTGPEGTAVRERPRGRAAPADVVVERGAARSAGRAGRAEARWDSDAYPLAVVRDRRTGRILAMARDGRLPIPGGDVSGIEVTLSDGVRTERARVSVR
ncbi:MAG: M66 family metalloprotease, partial [Gemmatimonadota bacterium]